MANINSKYAIIGEFVVAFEFIVQKVRFECSALLQARGLNDWRLSEVIFGQSMFTAYPLMFSFESMCNELLKNTDDSDELLERLKDIAKRYNKLVQKRNQYLHSFYPLSPISKATEDIKAIRYVPTGKGSRRQIVVSKTDDIKETTHELYQLLEDFRQFASDLRTFMYSNDMFVGFGESKED
jgi:hypothetical protein